MSQRAIGRLVLTAVFYLSLTQATAISGPLALNAFAGPQARSAIAVDGTLVDVAIGHALTSIEKSKNGQLSEVQARAAIRKISEQSEKFGFDPLVSSILKVLAAEVVRNSNEIQQKEACPLIRQAVADSSAIHDLSRNIASFSEGFGVAELPSWLLECSGVSASERQWDLALDQAEIAIALRPNINGTFGTVLPVSNPDALDDPDTRMKYVRFNNLIVRALKPMLQDRGVFESGYGANFISPSIGTYLLDLHRRGMRQSLDELSDVLGPDNLGPSRFPSPFTGYAHFLYEYGFLQGSKTDAATEIEAFEAALSTLEGESLPRNKHESYIGAVAHLSMIYGRYSLLPLLADDIEQALTLSATDKFATLGDRQILDHAILNTAKANELIARAQFQPAAERFNAAVLNFARAQSMGRQPGSDNDRWQFADYALPSLDRYLSVLSDLPQSVRHKELADLIALLEHGVLKGLHELRPLLAFAVFLNGDPLEAKALIGRWADGLTEHDRSDLGLEMIRKQTTLVPNEPTHLFNRLVFKALDSAGNKQVRVSLAVLQAAKDTMNATEDLPTNLNQASEWVRAEHALMQCASAPDAADCEAQELIWDKAELLLLLNEIDPANFPVPNIGQVFGELSLHHRWMNGWGLVGFQSVNMSRRTKVYEDKASTYLALGFPRMAALFANAAEEGDWGNDDPGGGGQNISALAVSLQANLEVDDFKRAATESRSMIMSLANEVQQRATSGNIDSFQNPRDVKAAINREIWLISRLGLDDVSRVFDAFELLHASSTSNSIRQYVQRAFSTLPGVAELIAQRDAAERLGPSIADIKEIDRQLRHVAPRYVSLRDQPLAQLDEVQSVLENDEAVVVYSVGAMGAYALIVTSGYSDLVDLQSTSEEIDSLVSSVRRSVELSGRERPREFDTRSSSKIFKRVFAPLLPHLIDKQRVYTVADGALQSIPFQLLVSAEGDEATGSKWLRDDFALATLPSMTSLVSLKGVETLSSAKEPLVGFADPDYGGDGRNQEHRWRSMSMRSLPATANVDISFFQGVAPLPETRGELLSIAGILGATENDLHFGTAASEANVKESDLARQRVVAFATHGVLAGENSAITEPSLLMSRPSSFESENDGILAASEIVGLEMNADWVLLSACNTAGPDGEPGADGLSGLARAFFAAGARNLVVSHWPVESEATSLLTTAFFNHLNEVKGGPEAMQSAMQELAAQTGYSHPAFWAPFVTVGVQ